MRQLSFGPLLLTFLILACSQPKPQNKLKIVKENGLSAAEKAVGWMSLFNGEDMSHWRVYKESGVRGWEVKDGKMIALGKVRADIITRDTFSHFELSLEWNISEGGNSGIFFNVREGDQYEAVYHTGPEYQILDDSAYPKSNKVNLCSANYDVHPPAVDVIKSAGTWNQSRLIVNKGHVEHWLNGSKTVAYDLNSDDWKARVAKSKWKSVASYAKYTSGHLALQDHGGQISFRNIKVRRL